MSKALSSFKNNYILRNHFPWKFFRFEIRRDEKCLFFHQNLKNSKNNTFWGWKLQEQKACFFNFSSNLRLKQIFFSSQNSSFEQDLKKIFCQNFLGKTMIDLKRIFFFKILSKKKNQKKILRIIGKNSFERKKSNFRQIKQEFNSNHFFLS